MFHLWDDKQKKYCADLVLKTEIKALKLRRDLIVVALVDKTLIFDFPSLEANKTLETAQNDEGLVGIANDRSPTHIVVAVPSA